VGDGASVAEARVETGRGRVNPERWKEVKKVLAGALERTPEQRSVYLDRSCSDASLRREVESLIAAHEQGDGSFMELAVVESNEALKPGAKLGPYEVLARIGAGGMGVVYRARDGRLERDVAIKVLPLGMLADDAARKRFRKEALALAKLNHPNIAAVYDVGEQEGTDYLVMECVPGKSLAEESGPISQREKDAVALGTQIAAALEDAHEQGIVHRDLKPGNIMVTPKRQVKVLDFGLAKILRVEGDSYATESFGQTDNLAGTLPYMAPEQLRGEPADARTDVHALGAVLFEIVTGQRPYQEDSTPQLTDAILHRQPVTPRALNARVSPEMERIILKCLEKERENRYQSAKEIGVDLRRLSSSSEAAIAGAATRPAARRRVALPAAGALVVALALAAGGYFYFHRVPRITDKDSIVVADFTNTTGDPVFDGALRQGLFVQLQQTPFLSVVSGDQITQTMKMMEQPPDAPLTPKLAREVCQRMNATVEIEGSIAALGNQYVLGLNAVNCATGESLAQTQIAADGKGKVLPALSHAASELRSKLGESGASLKRFDVPLIQATTPSLEALKAYNLGSQALWTADVSATASSYQRAVDLDPNFAMAQVSLGLAISALSNNLDVAESHVKKAYELRDRVSEYERLAISADYNLSVTRDLEQAVRFYEEWARLYPRDPASWNGLGLTCQVVGRYDEAATAFEQAAGLNPSAWAYGFLAINDYLQNRFPEARETVQEARAKHIEPYQASETMYLLAFVQNDQAGMTEQLARPWTDVTAGSQEDMQAGTASYSGRLSLSRDWSRRGIAAATAAKASIQAQQLTGELAFRTALLGRCDQARGDAKDAIGSTTDLDVRGWMALVLALCGDSAGARKLTDGLKREFPDATAVRYAYMPETEAALAIGRGDSQNAIESLSASTPYDLAYPYQGMPIYLRGQAYLAAHQGKEAAAQFQLMIDHIGVVQNQPQEALAHLGLGRAYALEGDTAKARAAYQDFLALWKDADPDIPVLKQAKAENAKLP
jgi:eukaryotic-like serine/threonine-protein kinase